MHQLSSGSGHITLLFSGRATTCDARRRCAHVDVSRSAATACYVRLPPNLPNRDFFGLRWTLLPDLGRTKGTEPTEADELHGLPLRQRRNAAHELHAGTPDRWRMNQTTQDCATVLATGVRAAVNEDSTERPEADVTHTLHNAAALAARYQRALPRRRAA